MKRRRVVPSCVVPHSILRFCATIRRRGEKCFEAGLKRFANGYIVIPLRDRAAAGISAPRPPFFRYHFMQCSCIQPLDRRQEIGTWKTSRRKTFRIRI